MSTGKMNVQFRQKGRFDDRFAKIANLGQTVFHAKDLANLWHIANTNTLHATLSRYVKKGLLFRVYKGLYSIKPVDQVDPILLGIKALHRFAYVSAETVLSEAGVMPQDVREVTLVSDLSKRFAIGPHRYRCRKLHDRYLHNTAGIAAKGAYMAATVPRAVADLLYFNKRAHLDAARSVDWQQVALINKQVYDSTSNDVIVKCRNMIVPAFLEALIDFIEKHINQTVITQDLSTLLAPETFQKIRKTLKPETLMFLRDELKKRDNG